MSTKKYEVLIPAKTDQTGGSDCDCSGGDCACSVSPLAYTESLTMKQLASQDLNKFKIPPLSQFAIIKDGHRIFYGPFHQVVVLNKAGQDLLSTFNNSEKCEYNLDDLELWETITKFLDHGLIRDTNTTLSSVRAEYQTLNAWLHLTDRCNLRCSYCYLPHVREDMSLETGYATIDATFRSALANGFKQVKLKYAGGEPLLRFPLIIELHNYAQSLAEKNVLGLEGVVLSNGTLLAPDMIETLKSLDLRLMISLDGMGKYHDSHRPYAGGRGSFADVAEAVDLALANGLVPNISLTVSSRTAEGLPEVMAWILERDLPFSLNFYRENELSASHEDMRLDEEKIINGMLAAFKVIEHNLPRRSLLGGIIDRANLSASHAHTCGVGQNYLVFDQNGQIAKCQMHIRKPITDVYVADPLAVIRADQIGIQNLSVEEKEGCKTCEWKYWCTGGCPLETYRATGRYDVKSPNCNIYKALYPKAVRLEGLRLLKYQDDPEVVVKL